MDVAALALLSSRLPDCRSRRQRDRRVSEAETSIAPPGSCVSPSEAAGEHVLPALAVVVILAASMACAASPLADQQDGQPPRPDEAIVTRHGMCDASAAVAVGPHSFIVASDEDNVLRVYGPGDAQPQPGAFDLSPFLGLEADGPEADIEGATRIGDVVYWITSHGADKKGRPRPSGRRLFATQIEIVNGRVKVTPVGKPYDQLVHDLAVDPMLQAYDLEAAARRAPKLPQALNIEGLAATPAGELLIGFRNPIPQGRALVVPIENPEDVVRGKAPAKLGSPMLLPLAGLGIRSIEYSAGRGEYLIVAGPAGEQGPFRLYRWTGSSTDAPVEVSGVSFSGLQPEALIVYPADPNEIDILSDDGTRELQGVACKKLPPDQRVFRELTSVIHAARHSPAP